MRRAALFLFAAIVCIWAVADAYQRRWLTDDSFIDFRYALNLVEGRGLVYNAGERVEGYTNFLWVLMLAGGMKIGIKPEPLSIWLGIFSYALTLLLLAGIYLDQSRNRAGVILPVAFLGLALHLHARIFATSGLEPAFFTLLLTAATISALFASNRKHWLLTGILCSLAALTRPEGFLIYALIVLYALWPNHQLNRLEKLGTLAAPGVFLLIPYLIWKFLYYGSLLPNTFYAKSANLSYWSQGIFYLYVYFRAYWPLALGWIAIALLPLNTLVLFSSITTLYLLYVAKVGGDFMFARFCLPITPLLLMALEFASYQIGRLQPFVAALLCVGILFPAFPPGLGTHHERLSGIADEHRAYPLSFVNKSEQIGKCLKEMTKDTDTRVVITGMQAMLAYYGEFPFVIEGTGGLTDSKIARAPLASRGRVGHEKVASWEYIYEREANFGLNMYFPEPPKDWDLEIIDFGCTRARIYIYNVPLMRTLKARGAKFQDFEQFLDSYIAQMDRYPISKVENDFRHFRQYYFDHNRDVKREHAFVNKLAHRS